MNGSSRSHEERRVADARLLKASAGGARARESVVEVTAMGVNEAGKPVHQARDEAGGARAVKAGYVDEGCAAGAGNAASEPTGTGALAGSASATACPGTWANSTQ